MLTYDLKKAPGVPLYEALYRCIRFDIQQGKLAPNEKLPSKRTLSENLEVSKITVEGAYNQLLSEGYIRSVEKVGYFVENVERVPTRQLQWELPQKEDAHIIDLTSNSPVHFPFSVWSKLQREVMLDLGEKLLLPLDNQGLPELRIAIAKHLMDFRGMQVNPRNILIGAGTDFLYNLLVQLLGRDKQYASENPGYGKIRKIYAAAGAACNAVRLDMHGVNPDTLGNTQVLHISPSHHFPTGLVTPLSRRQALLAWSRQEPDRFIIEDDYDSEFRFATHPMPTMFSLATDGRVIYMNTFSKTLAPSIRISYMILPDMLMERFRKTLGFYSCTVPSFEQYTLSRFLSRGYFEKHINRMRKDYKARRNRVKHILEQFPMPEKLTFWEENAGLHFVVKVETQIPDPVLEQKLLQCGIRVRCLSSYYQGHVPEDAYHCLVINYSGLSDAQLDQMEAMAASL